MTRTSSKAVTNLIELIRVATGRQSHRLTDEEWNELYAEAEKQSLIGVCFAGIEALGKEQLSTMDLLMDWLGQTEYIKSQNEIISTRAKEVTEPVFSKGKVELCCIPIQITGKWGY